MRSSVFATLRVGDEGALVALVPSADRRESALAHTLGYAFSHLTASPPEPIRRGLGPLARSLAALGDAETDERTALERIARACAAAIPGARLVVFRRLPPGQRTPGWPAAMRSGQPHEQGLWPYDAELTGLLLGRRSLVMREALTPAHAEADARWLARHGAQVRCAEPDPSGAVRLFASFDAAVLDEAPARQAAASQAAEGWAEAARWMGERLGYPPCCVDAFTRVRRRDDLTLFVERLPALPHPPASPLLVWLDGALALVSHAPCSLACAASRDLAVALLTALDLSYPGFARRWRALARRIHALTEDGRTFAIAAEGDLVAEGAARVIDAVELTPPSGADFDRVVRSAPDLAGVELRVDRGWLVAKAEGDAPPHTFTLVADHRGGDE